MEIKYHHFGAGRGKFYSSELLGRYNKGIDEDFTIICNNFDEKTVNDIEATLQKSLDNGKDFYSNAPEYIKEQMEEYEKMVDKDYQL